MTVFTKVRNARINPDECIDCGVCEPECPIGAIVSDTTDIENKDKWLLLNKKFSAIWPNINKKILCQNTKNMKKLKINLINIFQKTFQINMPKKSKKTKKVKKLKN